MSLAKRDIWIGGATITLALVGWFLIIPLGVDVPKSVKILLHLYTKLFHMINLQFPKKSVLATIKMANLNTH